MRRNSQVMVIVAVIILWGVGANAATKQVFLDNFGIFPQWRILHPDPKHYSIGPMYLTLWTLFGNLSDQNDYKNLFIISNPLRASDPTKAKDFQITIRVTAFKPVVHAQQVTITAYDDDDNHVRASNGYIDGRNWELSKNENGVFTRIRNATDADNPTFWMRLAKKGTEYLQYYSLNGTKFAQVGNISYPNPNPKFLGIVAHAGNVTEPPVPVFIEFFKVEEITTP